MYVDAFLNRKKDILQVAERINGKRVYARFPLCMNSIRKMLVVLLLVSLVCPPGNIRFRAQGK